MTPSNYVPIAAGTLVAAAAAIFLLAAVAVWVGRRFVYQFLARLEAAAPEASSELKSRARQVVVALAVAAFGIAGIAIGGLLLSRAGFDVPDWTPRQVVSLLLSRGLHALIIVAGAYITLRIANLSIERFKFRAGGDRTDPANLERIRRAATLGSIVSSTVTAAVWFFAVLMVLRELAIDVVPLLTGAGIAGLAIGFGAQNLVRDVISGFFMILEDQVGVGDVARIQTVTGVVEEINLRTIVLRDADGTVHVFPNGTITTLANLSKDFAYAAADVVVAHGENLERVMGALRGIGTSMVDDREFAPFLMGPLEILGVQELRESSLTLRVRFKTMSMKQFLVASELRRRIAIGFAARNIRPFRRVEAEAGDPSMTDATSTPAAGRPQPTRLFRWLVLVFISLAMFGNYYVYDCISPLADVLKEQLKFSDSSIGLLQAIYSFPNIVMVLVGGIIIDRIGTKRSTLLFGLLCFLGAAVAAWPDVPAFGPLASLVTWLGSVFGFEVESRVLASMVAGRLIFGLGAESLIVAVTTAIARWFKGKELSFAFGMNLTIARLGSFAALNSPSWASESYRSWQLPLVISVGFATFCVVGAVLYWVLEASAERRYALGAAGPTDKVNFREVFNFGTSYWYIVALCITFYSGIFPFQTFAVKFFIEAHGESRETAGFLSSMLTLFAMIGTPLFGLLVDRVGKRSLFMMLGSLLLIPVYLIMAYTDVSLYVPMAMMGIAFSLIPAVMWPSVAYVVGEEKLGTAYGLMTMIQNIGLFGFNLLIGWANDTWGASAANPAGYTPGMWMFSMLGFLGLFFALMLRRSEQGPHAHGLETITTKS